MLKSSLQRRIVITASFLVACTVMMHAISHGERMPTHRPLREFPLALGAWHGEERPLEERIVKATGADDYVNRVYTTDHNQSVSFYVGFYESQRTGDTIHSPKNCLPGTGWEPVRAGRITIDVPGVDRIEANEYLVEKGLDHELAVYWYQVRGRAVASEYWGKVWQVVDAITRNRTDGALIRIVTGTEDGEDKARDRAIGFVRAIYPRLGEFLPN